MLMACVGSATERKGQVRFRVRFMVRFRMMFSIKFRVMFTITFRLWLANLC